MDYYDLLTSPDEEAKQKAAMMSQALRGTQNAAAANRGMAMVAGLGQNSLLKGLGQSSANTAQQLSQQAQFGQGQLAQAGGQRAGHVLQKAMQAESQKFHGGENQLNRNATRSNLELELGMRQLLAQQKADADKQSDAAKAGNDLRKEFNNLPEVKAFKEVQVAFDKVSKAGSAKSAAGDMAMIFGYMKLLDPGSSVREGEYANAQNAAGVPERIVAMYNRAKNGQLLTPEMRTDFQSQAVQLFNAHKQQMAPVIERYRGLATSQAAAPDDVAVDSTVRAGPGGKKVFQQNGKWFVED